MRVLGKGVPPPAAPFSQHGPVPAQFPPQTPRGRGVSVAQAQEPAEAKTLRADCLPVQSGRCVCGGSRAPIATDVAVTTLLDSSPNLLSQLVQIGGAELTSVRASLLTMDHPAKALNPPNRVQQEVEIYELQSPCSLPKLFPWQPKLRNPLHTGRARGVPLTRALGSVLSHLLEFEDRPQASTPGPQGHALPEGGIAVEGFSLADMRHARHACHGTCSTMGEQWLVFKCGNVEGHRVREVCVSPPPEPQLPSSLMCVILCYIKGVCECVTLCYVTGVWYFCLSVSLQLVEDVHWVWRSITLCNHPGVTPLLHHILTLMELKLVTSFSIIQGIILVYDITDEKSFENIQNWMKSIKENASAGVSRMLLGNKCDIEAKRKVSSDVGEKLAKDHGIRFFETSAKSSINVEESFAALARDILMKASKKALRPVKRVAKQPPLCSISTSRVQCRIELHGFPWSDAPFRVCGAPAQETNGSALGDDNG
ncbi:hypothetical protein P4O66_001407 [Electrophorus voltai]|uniref:small monomeric GTPase n=1 Tax=Electrophorus voltai TaxID=2609070 RepID=A0AAD8ZB41_9TELE|nr:hypothetical protein P4O66_001407 [Electrophorus voltai]